MNEMGNQGTMEQMTTTGHTFAPTREFTVGGVLGRSFSTLRAKPLVFFGLALFVLLPAIGVRLLVSDRGLSRDLMFALVNLTFGQLMQGAMAYAAFRILRGRTVSLGESLARGLRRLGSMVVISILVSVGMSLGVFMLFYLPILILGRFGLLLGTILTLMAGFALFTSMPVMISACVIEGLGPVASINRATELTKGYRWKIFALFLLVGIGILVLITLLPIVLRLLFFWSWIANVTVFCLAILALLAFVLLMCPVIYYGLREAKGGVSVENLSNVFD